MDADMTKRKDTPEVAPEEGANIAAADALMEIFAMSRQETYYALCDAVREMGLAQSRGQAKRLCIQGAITVNGKTERDPWRGVCRFDEITKGG